MAAALGSLLPRSALKKAAPDVLAGAAGRPGGAHHGPDAAVLRAVTVRGRRRTLGGAIPPALLCQTSPLRYCAACYCRFVERLYRLREMLLKHHHFQVILCDPNCPPLHSRVGHKPADTSRRACS